MAGIKSESGVPSTGSTLSSVDGVHSWKSIALGGKRGAVRYCLQTSTSSFNIIKLSNFKDYKGPILS